MKDGYWKNEVAKMIDRPATVVKFGNEQLGISADIEDNPPRGGRRLYSFDNAAEFRMVEEYRALGLLNLEIIKELIKQVRAARKKRAPWWVNGIKGEKIAGSVVAHIFTSSTAESFKVILEDLTDNIVDLADLRKYTRESDFSCTVKIAEILERVVKSIKR